MALRLSESIDVASRAVRDLHALDDQLVPHERHGTCLVARLLLDERLSGSLTASWEKVVVREHAAPDMLRVKCKMPNLTADLTADLSLDASAAKAFAHCACLLRQGLQYVSINSVSASNSRTRRRPAEL